MKRKANKRVNERRACLVPIDGKESGMQTVDISRGGIGLLSSKALPLNQKLAVAIETEPQGESVLVMGKVVWVNKLSSEDRYRIGMKFHKAFSRRTTLQINGALSS